MTSVIVPVVMFLAGIGVTYLCTKVWPSEAEKIRRENKILARKYETSEEYLYKVNDSLTESQAALAKMTEIAKTHTIDMTPATGEFEEDPFLFNYKANADLNFDRMAEDITRIANGQRVKISFEVRVIGAWKRFLVKERKWTWHSDELNATGKEVSQSRATFLTGPAEQVISEAKLVFIDTAWSRADKDGKIYLPNASIIFSVKAWTSVSARKDPDVRFIEVAVPVPEVRVIEKIVYLESGEGKIEDRLPDDLTEKIRAQVEVELTLANQKRSNARQVERV